MNRPEALTPGPYWSQVAANGEHLVCGRHGKIITRYRPEQGDMAEAHLRTLQTRFVRQQRQSEAKLARIRDAAPELLEALETCLEARKLIADGDYENLPDFGEWEERARAAIAKARGEA